MITIYTFYYTTINTAVLLLVCFYIFSKTLHHPASLSHKIFYIVWSLLLALFYTFNSSWVSLPMLWSMYCAASILLIFILTKLKPDVIISAFLLSYGMANVLLLIASFLISLLFMPFASDDYRSGTIIDYNTASHLLMYSLVSILQFILAYLTFRLRRFQKGFPFLLKGYAIIITLISTGIVLILATWISSIKTSEYALNAYLYSAGILIIGMGIYIWIKRSIKRFYSKMLKDNSIKLLEQELAEQQKENQRLTEQNNILRIANHKIQHRLAALERSTNSLFTEIKAGGFSEEFSNELATTLENIQHTAQDYQNDIGALTGKNMLPSTKIKMLDDLFREFNAQFIANKIDFKLKVNGSIPYMVEKVIEQGMLETMIGDHLQNALVAVSASDNAFRSVWAMIGLTGDGYAFSVHDSGIPFTIDTLARLGTERVTTHGDHGGSGIGFMTTFEAIRKCNASLIIHEKIPSTADYTKTLTIRFDGKGQYIIETYRAGEFLAGDRYKVEDIGIK